MRRLAPIVTVAVLALAPLSAAALDVDPAVLKVEADRVAVIAKVKGTVLAIFSATGGGGGSGVVIAPDGYALTNFHVAQPSGKAMKCGMADGKVYDAVIVGIDPVGDVALIKLFGRDDFPCAELGNSDAVRQGDSCLVMGNPFLLATDFQPTVTCGIISGVHRYQYPAGTILEYADCLQTDASINPGNSGGPLFDVNGRVIGINGRASFEKRGRVNVGVGYAISINQIKNFMGHLRAGRIVDHATLGARVTTDDERRAVVSDILDESDAYRRGLRYGDEIVSFGGRPIRSANAFQNALGIFPKGWRVPMSFRRDGKQHDVLVRLAGVHTEADLIQKTTGRPRQVPMPIPKPGEKPGEKPGSKREPPKDRDEDAPIPLPDDHPPLRPAPMPEIVKKHFEERRGYANYYFNRLNRDRVWKAWTARGSLGSADAVWTIAGPLGADAQYRFEVSEAGVMLKLPLRETEWAATDEIPASLLPEGSGGLLPALFLWRRLAVGGPEKYGDVYYLGTAPFAGGPQPADVLVGLHGGVECHFYFDPKQGLLVGLELFAPGSPDPCEIYLGDYREADGRFVPQRMEVRCGEVKFADFKIDRFAFGPPAREAP